VVEAGGSLQVGDSIFLSASPRHVYLFEPDHGLSLASR
jgi:hypothetical protein